MPRKSSDHDLRDVPHDEEMRARAAFLKDLKKRGWKKIEIEAAEGGWEWAFDVGFDQPNLDCDAAGDLADCVLDGSKRHSRGAIADCVYEGICAARDLQSLPDPNAGKDESVAEIKAITGR